MLKYVFRGAGFVIDRIFDGLESHFPMEKSKLDRLHKIRMEKDYDPMWTLNLYSNSQLGKGSLEER